MIPLLQVISEASSDTARIVTVKAEGISYFMLAIFFLRAHIPLHLPTLYTFCGFTAMSTSMELWPCVGGGRNLSVQRWSLASDVNVLPDLFPHIHGLQLNDF